VLDVPAWLNPRIADAHGSDSDTSSERTDDEDDDVLLLSAASAATVPRFSALCDENNIKQLDMMPDYIRASKFSKRISALGASKRVDELLVAAAIRRGTVRVFRQKFTREGSIGSHACSLEANMRVTNGIPLGCPLFLPVHTVNCVQTLKVYMRQA
jgi:hypothetical protein